MKNREDRVKRFSELHYRARYKAGKSQEYMANELGVAKKTVQNWENGVTSPSFFQSLEWFRVLNVNPFPHYLAYTFPSEFTNLKASDTDDKVNEAFMALVSTLPISAKRSILYLFYGEHGSSANAMIQLMLAYLHTPIKARITQAVNTAYIYELEKELGNDICKGNIQPDMEILNKAITRAKASVLHNETGYSYIEEGQSE